MPKNFQPSQNLTRFKQVMTWILTLAIFVSALPVSTLFALSDDSFFASGYTRSEAPANTGGGLSYTDSFVPGYRPSNENAPISSSSPLAETSTRGAAQFGPATPVTTGAGLTAPSLTADATLEEADVVVENGVIVSLTPTGEAKVQSANTLSIPALQGAHTIGERLLIDQKLQSLIIGEGITTIQAHAFQRTGISGVNLPASLTTVGDYAFADNALTAFVPNGTALATLGNYALYNNLLTQVNLPVTTVGEQALAVNRLTTANLPNVTTLKAGAFFDNPDLTSVHMSSPSVTEDTFQGSAFNQTTPVGVYLAESVTGITPIGDHYLINPVAVTISLKEKNSKGLLQPANTTANTEAGWTQSVKNSQHSAASFPLSVTLPTVEGYRLVEGQTGVTVGATVGGVVSPSKLSIQSSQISNYTVNVDVFYELPDKPQIIVSEGKQLIWPINKELSTREILQDVRFINARGEDVSPYLSNGQQDPRIRVSPTTLTRPNKETTQTATIRFTDVDAGGLREEVEVTFTYSESTDEAKEIIEGKEWLYSDFTYNNNQLTGFSPQGLNRLETNKNVVLPGYNPTTKQKITQINPNAFKERQMDTVDFQKLDSLEHIYNAAFQDAGISALFNFDKLTNLRVLHDSAFRSLNVKHRFTEIDFSPLKKLSVIAGAAFLNGSLEKVTFTDMPDFEHIAGYAFKDNKLQSVTFENLAKFNRFDGEVFYNNRALSDLTLRNLPNFKTIHGSAFRYTNIKDLVLEDLPELQVMYDHAFTNSNVETVRLANLPKLTHIHYAFSNNQIKEVELKDLPSLVYFRGFENNQIERITLSNLPNLETIGGGAFYNNPTFKGDLILEDLPKLKTIESSALRFLAPEGSIDRVVLRNLPALTTIQGEAFGQNRFNELVLDNLPQLTQIYWGVFKDSRMKKLTLANLPALEVIHGSAFENDRLEEVTFRNLPALKRINDSANFRSDKLVKFDARPEDVPVLEYIGGHTFQNNRLGGTFNALDFPALKEIGVAAYYNGNFSAVNFKGHPTLEKLGQEAFTGSAHTFSSVDLSDMPNLTTINNAFLGVGDRQALRYVNVANNPKLEVLGGFPYNNNLEAVTLANLPVLKEIGSHAFHVDAGSTTRGLKQIDLSPFTTLETIRQRAFDGTRLSELKLPASVTRIEERAYAETLIRDVDLSHLTGLTHLGTGAFYKIYAPYNTFKLPATAEPIELGRHVAALTAEQRNFTSTPGVKLKLTDAEPFVNATNDPLVLEFKNDDQISWTSNIANLNPNKPLVIFIENVTDTERIASAPAGLLINPGKVTVKYVDASNSNALMNGTRAETKYLKVGDSLDIKTFAGYNLKEVQSNPADALTRAADNNSYTVAKLPVSNSELVFVYEPLAAVDSTDVDIQINYGNNQGADFYREDWRDRWREFRIDYNLTNVNTATEKNSKVVITLPPYARKGSEFVRFPNNIPGYTLAKAPYYNEETGQIIYEIAEFTNSNPMFQIVMSFQFDPLKTPKKIEQHLKASYVLTDGRRKGAEAVGPAMYPNYGDLGFSKRIDNHAGQNDHYATAVIGSNNQYANFVLNYKFYFNDIRREAERIIIKDTLPTYVKINDVGQEETVRAVFDSAKNPEWQDNGDGTVTLNVPSDVLNTILHTSGDGKGYVNEYEFQRAIPSLTLEFPRAKPQTVSNQASMEYYILNRDAEDPEKFEKTHTKTDRLNIFTGADAFGSTKYSNGQTRFIPGDDDTNTPYLWTLDTHLNKTYREFEGKREYFRTKYSNIEFWEVPFNPNNFYEYLRFHRFTPNTDLKLELFEHVADIYGRHTPEHVLNQLGANGTPFATYQLTAGMPFTLPQDASERAKSFRFIYEGEVDSDTYEAHLSEEDKKKSSTIPFKLSVEVESRLRDGKTFANINRDFINGFRAYATREVPDREDITTGVVTGRGEAYKWLRRANRYIQVTKNNLTHSNNANVWNDQERYGYTLGFNTGWTDANIPMTKPFYFKNFELVDLLSKDFDLKPTDISLNPEFLKAGGSFRMEPAGDNVKLIFSAPSVPSTLGWVAKLSTKVKEGTPTDTVLITRAYIKFVEDENFAVEHRNPQATPEENNDRLTTATHQVTLKANSSAHGHKFIRSVTKNTPWTSAIQTEPGEEIEYKIEFTNNFNRELKEFAVLDILPHENDVTVAAGADGSKAARGSQFSNILISNGLSSISGRDFKTNTNVSYSNAEYPVVMLSKLDGFPRSAAEGEVSDWLASVLNDSSYITNDPAQAKAIYIGGKDSVLPERTRVEFVFKMKVPEKDFAASAEWQNTSAVNSAAYLLGAGSKYREINSVSNTLESPRRSIKVKKVDAVSQKALEGATFVLKQEGEEDKIAISDKEGWLYFAHVRYAPFTLQETVAPTGYVLDEQVREYTGLDQAKYEADKQDSSFSPNTFYELEDLTLENTAVEKPAADDQRIFTFNITKKDAQDNPLAYVKFRLENMSDGNIVEGLTNRQGQLQFTGLLPTQYRLTEVSNLNRYTFITPLQFSLPLPEDFSSAVFSSFSRATDENNANHEIYTVEIPNRSFNLELTKLGIQDLKGEKQDHLLSTGEGVKLPQVTFKLYQTDVEAGDQPNGAQGTLVATLVTDEKGKASLSGLVPNRLYRLAELSTVDGYERREDNIYFYVDAQGAVKTANSESYLRADLLIVSNVQATSKGSASVKKIDAVTNATLEGAKFQLFKVNGDRYEAVEENGVVETNAQGLAYFRDLTYGRYRIKEIESPDGYVRSSESYDFTVQPYAKNQHFAFTVKNKKMLLRIEKVQKIAGPFVTNATATYHYEQQADKEGLFVANRTVYRRLKGATFSLTPKYIDPLTQQAVPEVAVTPLKTTDADGYTVYEYSAGLSDFGSYQLEELTAPEGYTPLEPISIKIDQVVNYTKPENTLYIENTKKVGSLSVAKFGEDEHTVLPGVKFALYKGHIQRADLANHKDDLVTPDVQFRTQGFDDLIDEERYNTTNNYGVARWDSLELGDYTLVEISTVNPYVVLEEPTHFSLTASQTDARFSFYNKLKTVTVKLQKQNDLGEAIANLEGTQFDFYYNGKLHSTGQLSQNEEGIVLFHNVPVAGKYEIREILAPAGYVILDDGKLSFSATSAQPLQDNHQVSLKNKRQVNIKASKTWVGGNAEDRPEVHLKLFRQAEGENTKEAVEVDIKEIGQNNATVEFGTFDVYKHVNGQAKAYTYSVQEVTADGSALNLAASDYTATYAQEVTEASEDNDNIEQRLIKVTNRYQSKQTNFTVKKIWRGGQKAVKPNYKFVLYRQVAGGAPEQVMNGSEVLSAAVPTTPNSIFHNLLAFLGQNNNEVHNQVVFTGLDVTDEDGKVYTYFVEEVKDDLSEITATDLFQPEEVRVQATAGQAVNGIAPLSATVVNQYHAPKTTIVARKAWTEGPVTRPETHFFLRRYTKERGILGTEEYKLDTNFTSEAKTLAAHDNDGSQEDTISFETLPTHNDAGEEYFYESVEFDGTDRTNLNWAPEKYTKEEGNFDTDEPLLTKNAYDVPKSTFEIRTVWTTIDGEDVPSSVQYTIQRKLNTGDTPTQVGNANTTSKANHKVNNNEKLWSTQSPQVALTDNEGNPYIYNVTGSDVPGYTVNVVEIKDGNTVTGFELRYTPVTTKKTVTKVWDNTTGEENPNSVKVQLTRNGTTYGNAVDVTATASWTHEFTNLPTHNAEGEVYTYSVVEVAPEGYTAPNTHTGSKVPGYDAPVVASVDGGFTITNRRSVHELEVTKKWVDESDKSDQPEQIVVLLYRNKAPGAQAYKRLTLTGDGNTWTGSFSNLPTFDNAGNAYQYEVEEEAVAGYTSSKQGTLITNTRVLSTVPTTKVWDMVEEGSYPASITYILKRDNVELARQTVNKPTNPAEANAWNYTFTSHVVEGESKKLAQINPSNSQAYRYTVEEVAPAGYTVSVDADSNTITNTQQGRDITLTKRWVKGSKPDVTLTLQRQVEGGQKEDVRDFSTQGLQRTDVEDNGVTYTVVTFPAYRVPTHNPAGLEYTYTVDEKQVPEDYTKSIDGFVVTNTYGSPKITVTGHVNWVQGKSLKPATFVKLYRKVPNGLLEEVDVDPIEVTREGRDDLETVEANWDNVPAKDEQGRRYIYEIRLVTEDESVWNHPSFTTEQDSEVEITITYNPKTKVFSFNKVWIAEDENMIPESITVRVFRGVFAGQIDEAVEVITLNRDDYTGTTWAFNSSTAYPLQDNEGRNYIYNVVEDNIIGFELYSIEPIVSRYPIYNTKGEETGREDRTTGFNITNQQKLLAFEVVKIWENDTNEPNPESVHIRLFRNDVLLREEDLSADTNWKVDFENLPTHSATGEEYTYTVTEDPVTAYTSVVDVATEMTTIVRNTRITLDLEVSKTWVDEANNLDQPDQITIKLYRKLQGSTDEPAEYASLNLTGDTWTGVFENLPRMNNEGVNYVYTIDEVDVPGYEKVIDEYSVTNTRILTRVPVTKTWDMLDANDADSYPASIKYELLRDGEKIAEHTVAKPTDPSAADAWNYTFTQDEQGNKLPQVHPTENRDYVYRVNEIANAGFAVTEGTTEHSFVNIQNRQEIVLTKRWFEGAMTDVELVLSRTVNGQTEEVQSFTAEVASGTEQEIDGKVYTVVNSPAYVVPTHTASGEEYTYTVDERVVPENYEKSIEDFTVTNTFKAPVQDITASIDWVKGQTVKPDAFFRLFRRVVGTNDYTAVPDTQDLPATRPGLASEERVEGTWNDMPELDKQGRAYEYEVRLVDDQGNAFSHSNYTVDNVSNTHFVATYRVDTFNLSLEKTWNILHGEILPRSISFTLNRGFAADATDEEVGVFSLDQSMQQNNVWTRSITNLPRQHEDGRPYFYALTEQAHNAYTASIEEVKDNNLLVGYAITNSPVTIDKSVRVEWINSTSNPKEDNPATVQVQLKRNGANYGRPVTLTTDATDKTRTNTYNFDRLPRYDEQGREYVYTFEQAKQPAYHTPVVDNDQGVITNTRIVEALEVEKVWKDESNQNLPAKVTIQLYRKLASATDKGTVYKTLDLNAAGTWKGTFENLPSFNLEGEAYSYSIDEVDVPGFDKEVNGNSVTNTRRLLTLPVTKTWTLTENVYPESITYILKRDGVKIAEQEITPADPSVAGAWNFTFVEDENGNKLPVNRPNSEERYNYTLEEVVARGYNPRVETVRENGAILGFKVNNVQETVDIELTKRWLGGKKQDATLHVQRTAGGVSENYLDQVLKAADGKAVQEGDKTYIVTKFTTKVAKYNAEGEAYTFVVTETIDEKSHYQAEIDEKLVGNKFTAVVTNTFVIPRGDIEGGMKVWENLYRGQKVPSITLKLYRRYRHQAIGQPVPNVDPVVLPAFTHDSKVKTKEVEIAKFENVELTDDTGEEFFFHLVEVDENGELGAPKGFWHYPRYFGSMKVYNRYTSVGPVEDPDKPTTPTTPGGSGGGSGSGGSGGSGSSGGSGGSSGSGSRPTTPSRNPNRDRVPNTSAFAEFEAE